MEATNVTPLPGVEQHHAEDLRMKKQEVAHSPKYRLEAHIKAMEDRLYKAMADKISLEAEFDVKKEAQVNHYNITYGALQERLDELQKMLSAVYENISHLNVNHDQEMGRLAVDRADQLAAQDKIIAGHRAMVQTLRD